MATNDKNSPENKALFKNYASEALRIAKTSSVTSDTLVTLSKQAEKLTEQTRKKLLLNTTSMQRMAKSIAEMKIAAQGLRANPQSFEHASNLLGSYTQVQRYRQVMSAARVQMPKTLALEEFSARGHLSQITRGGPTVKVLEKILTQVKEENEKTPKKGILPTYASHLKNILATHAGKPGFLGKMVSGGLGGKGGLLGRALGALPEEAGAALGIAAIAAAIPILAVKLGLGIQKNLTGKYTPYLNYATSQAQLTRYGGMGKLFSVPGKLTGPGLESTQYALLQKTFPQFSSGHGVSPAVINALAQSGIPIRNTGEGAKILKSFGSLQTSRGGLGGLGNPQIMQMLSQIYGYGFASRSGGTMVGTSAEAMAKSMYGSAAQEAIGSGFDKSKVLQTISESITSMAQSGAMQARLPGGLYSLFASHRGMLPGLANPTHVANAVNALSGAGANILQNPAVFMGLRNYVMKSMPGKGLLGKLQGMAAKNPAMHKFMEANKGMNPELMLAQMTQLGYFRPYLMGAVNTMLPGSLKQFRMNALQNLGLNAAEAEASTGVTGRAPFGYATSGTLTGIPQMKKLSMMMRKTPAVQKYLQLLKSQPMEATGYYMQQMKTNKHFRDFFDYGAKAGLFTPGTTGTKDIGFNPSEASYGSKAYDLSKTGHGTLIQLSDIRGYYKLKTAAQREAAVNRAYQQVPSAQLRTEEGSILPGHLAGAQRSSAMSQALDVQVSQNWVEATAGLNATIQSLDSDVQHWISLLTRAVGKTR